MQSCFLSVPLLFLLSLSLTAFAQTESNSQSRPKDSSTSELKRYIVFFKNFYPQPLEQQKTISPNSTKIFLYNQRFNSQNRMLDYLRGLKLQGYPVNFRAPNFLNFLTVQTTELVIEQLAAFPEVLHMTEDIPLSISRPLFMQNSQLNLPLSGVSVCQKSNIGIHTSAVLESWMKADLPVSRVYVVGSENQFSQSSALLDFQNSLFSFISQSLTNALCSIHKNSITHYVLSDERALLSDALTLIDSSLEPDLNFSTDDQSHIQVLGWSSQFPIFENTTRTAVCSVLNSVTPVITLIAVANNWMENDVLRFPQSCASVLIPESPLNPKLRELMVNTQNFVNYKDDNSPLGVTFTRYISHLIQPRKVKTPSFVLEHLSPRGLSYFGGTFVDSVTVAIRLSIAYSLSHSSSVPDYVSKMQNLAESQGSDSIEWR